MPKKSNEDLITETAEILLKAIQTAATSYSTPEQMKACAEAFALVAQFDTNAPREPGRVAFR